MSFATLAGLQQRIRDYYARNDAPFVARLGDFVTLAEQRIYWGGAEPLETPPVRIRAMEGSNADVTVTDGLGFLPDLTDNLFLEPRTGYWVADPIRPLAYLDPVGFWRDPDAGLAGALPRIYTVEDDRIRVAPATSGTFRISYYKRFPALTAGGDSNFLLLNHPALYLHATMMEAGVFTKEAQRTQTALQQYRSTVGALNRVNLRSTYQGPLVPTLGVPSP